MSNKYGRGTPPRSFARFLAVAGIGAVSFRERLANPDGERSGSGYRFHDEPLCEFTFPVDPPELIDDRVMTFMFRQGYAIYYDCLGTGSGFGDGDKRPVVVEGPTERFTIRGFGLRPVPEEDDDAHMFDIEVEVVPKVVKGNKESSRTEHLGLEELWERTGLWKEYDG